MAPPSSPFNARRRDMPAASDRVSASNRCPSIDFPLLSACSKSFEAGVRPWLGLLFDEMKRSAPTIYQFPI